MTSSNMLSDPLGVEAPRVEEPPVGGKRHRRPVARFLESYALLVILIALIAFFSLWPQTSDIFPTAANLKILIASQAVLGVVTFGMLVPLVCQEFDLSVGATTALSAIVSAQLLTAGQPILAAVVVALGIGVVVGSVNGFIVTRMGVNAVVATLGTTTLIIGVIRQDTGGIAQASNIPAVLTDLGSGDLLGIPNIFIAMLIVAFGVYLLLGHTSFGRQLYALGSNPLAAELVGLRTRRIRFLALLIGATLCGLAGFLYVMRAGGADPKIADAFLLPAWAAAFLSAASVQPGRYNVWGAMIAIYLLAVLNNGLNIAGAEPFVSNYINGAALVLGVALATYVRKKSSSSP